MTNVRNQFCALRFLVLNCETTKPPSPSKGSGGRIVKLLTPPWIPGAKQWSHFGTLPRSETAKSPSQSLALEANCEAISLPRHHDSIFAIPVSEMACSALVPDAFRSCVSFHSFAGAFLKDSCPNAHKESVPYGNRQVGWPACWPARRPLPRTQLG